MRTSSSWATGWSVARAVMAVLVLAAIFRQLGASVGTALAAGRDVAVTIANFFSFFTILSNLTAAIVLLWAAIWFWTRGRRGADAEPRGLAVALACVSTFMIITGIVYNVLLRNVVLPQGSEPVWWSNEVLHLVGPLFLLADVLVGPLRRALSWRALWVIVAFPILWAAYTMVRGPLTTNPVSGEPYWYPYPFLNPNNPDLQPVSGYAGVMLYVGGIALAFLLVGSFVVWWSRRHGVADDRGVVALARPTRGSSPESHHVESP